ncbi:MAG: FAD-dependent monooxygenase, partial [Actinocrinis sp.]
MSDPPLDTEVLIVGAGPAGALLGCLLARRGVEVVAVGSECGRGPARGGEPLAAPSVITLGKLGFGPALRAHGYLRTPAFGIRMEGRTVFRIEHRRLPLGALPIEVARSALVGGFTAAASDFPNHTRLPGTVLSSLIEQDGAVRGALVGRPDGGRTEIRARLVVGADGRRSRVREAANLNAGVAAAGHGALSFTLSFTLPRPADWGEAAELVAVGAKYVLEVPTFPGLLR